MICRSVVALASALVVAGYIGLMPQNAQAKSWTITQRQEKLSREITQGRKSGELTLKEADSLQNGLDDLISKEGKMKDSNAGKLSYKDQEKLEKELNKISVQMFKLKLAKRTE
jgi:hypothetical protein